MIIYQKFIACLALHSAVGQDPPDHGAERKLMGKDAFAKMFREMTYAAKKQMLFEIENFQQHPKLHKTERLFREYQNYVTLAAFDGQQGTSYSWRTMNDPVMGGQSHSTFEVEGSEGHFRGLCAIVPFLKAPGFCKIGTESSFFSAPHFADASRFANGALYLEVETTTPEYRGFKVAFGAKNAIRPPGSMHHSSPTFKTGFNVSGTARTTVKVPFTSFSIDWSDFTGRCDTKDPNNGFQHHCCSAEHPEVCPTAENLAHITSLEIWAEGVEGEFDLRIISIGAGPWQEAPVMV